MGFSAVIAVGAFILFVLANIFKILPEWERGVVFATGSLCLELAGLV